MRPRFACRPGRIAALVPASLWLAACNMAGIGDSFYNAADVTVTEVRRADNCGVPDSEPRVTLFADRGALERYQSQRWVEFEFVQGGGRTPLRPGAYALIEYDGAGGLAVSRRARLRRDGILVLAATFLSPPAGTQQHAGSSCVLIALPADASVHKLHLRDQVGVTRARSQDAEAAPPEPAAEAAAAPPVAPAAPQPSPDVPVGVSGPAIVATPPPDSPPPKD